MHPPPEPTNVKKFCFQYTCCLIVIPILWRIPWLGIWDLTKVFLSFTPFFPIQCNALFSWWWLPLRSLRTLGALSRLSERKLHFYQLSVSLNPICDICLPSSFIGEVRVSLLFEDYEVTSRPTVVVYQHFCSRDKLMSLPAEHLLLLSNTFGVEMNLWVFLVHARSALDKDMNVYATLQNLNFVLTLMNAVQHWWPDPLKIVSAEMSFSGRLKTRSLRER